MITVFKYVAKNSKKFDRENSYFNGVERIGYETKKIEESELGSHESKGWSRSLPEKGAKKVKANDEHSQVSNTETSTESSGASE